MEKTVKSGVVDDFLVMTFIAEEFVLPHCDVAGYGRFVLVTALSLLKGMTERILSVGHFQNVWEKGIAYM